MRAGRSAPRAEAHKGFDTHQGVCVSSTTSPRVIAARLTHMDRLHEPRADAPSMPRAITKVDRAPDAHWQATRSRQCGAGRCAGSVPLARVL